MISRWSKISNINEVLRVALFESSYGVEVLQ